MRDEVNQMGQFGLPHSGSFSSPPVCTNNFLKNRR